LDPIIYIHVPIFYISYLLIGGIGDLDVDFRDSLLAPLAAHRLYFEGDRALQRKPIEGLPDGLFSYQKVNFGGPWNGKWWYIYLGPFGIFYGLWYTLWPFDIACGYLVYFSRFGMFGQRKIIWQPW
jgi:hypothetical protein